MSVDTASDLLDWFDEEKTTVSPAATPSELAVPAPGAPGDVEITLPGADASGSDEASATSDRERNTKLLLRIKARKSLSQDFYDSNSRLVLEKERPLELFQSLKFDVSFDSQHVPQGDGEFLRNKGISRIVY